MHEAKDFGVDRRIVSAESESLPFQLTLSSKYLFPGLG
jgi:hypothetical protein